MITKITDDNFIQEPYDCLRIQQVLLDNDYYASLHDCEELWHKYSNDQSASWLYLPNNNKELWQIVKEYL